MVSGDGERLLAPNGAPIFLLGMNYEGPGDRAWQMWSDAKFDPGLIDADFQRAAAAGTRALRLFVQAPLLADINAGKWDKLDQVVATAERRGLQLVVSLRDYPERDLARVSATAEQVARRYRGRPGILAYDLKNEPRFGDLAFTRYAAPVPLQQPGLVQTYGERLPRAEVPAFRASEEGARTVPAWMSDDEAWVYINNLRLYREFLDEAAAWVREKGAGATSLDYMDDPAGAKWGALFAALDETLRAWIQPQLEAVRRGDPAKPVTVGHADPILAKLPANHALDYQTLHRYPTAAAAGLRSALVLLAALQRAHPDKPYVLGEFGYATEKLDPAKAALYETAALLGLLSQRAAGGAKWVLNDMPEGYNMRERTLGAFALDGSPKPVVDALAALRRYVDTSGSAPGELRLEDDRDVGLRYVYRASDALLLGGKQVDAGVAKMAADGPTQLFATFTDPGVVRLWASGPAQLTLDLQQLLGSRPPAELRLARLNGSEEQPVALAGRSGAAVAARLDQPGWYALRLGAPTDRPADYEIPQGRFFTQTNGRREQGSFAGYSVTNADGIPFWDAFQAMGGVDLLGYPVSRRFELDGFTVQAFQKAVLQWRPDQGGEVWFLNTFDVLHDRGKDDWLEVYRQTPRPFDTRPDAGLPWEQVVARHLAFLDKVPAPLRERFLADPQWLDRYGLPVATAEYPNVVVVRAQRATFQYWKVAVPWAQQGEVTMANGGDLAKEAGLWPWLAVTPENAPR